MLPPENASIFPASDSVANIPGAGAMQLRLELTGDLWPGLDRRNSKEVPRIRCSHPSVAHHSGVTDRIDLRSRIKYAADTEEVHLKNRSSPTISM